MSKSMKRNSMFAVLGALGWPLLFGSALSVGFYLLVFQGPLNHPTCHRYFASHPVSFVATVMFFVGLAALLFKLADVCSQFGSLKKIQLPRTSDNGERVEGASDLLDFLNELPVGWRESYLGRRLTDALEYVERSGAAAGLDDELKYLADLDVARQQESYALIRIIIWATPMLGFLGTVMGITAALGGLDAQELAANIQVAMDKLLSGLYPAFDTTTIALAFSVSLMFIQFLIDRLDTSVLSAVDDRTNFELVGRFQTLGTASDPHLASIERMAQAVIESTEGLVTRQIQMWQSTIDAAHQQWSQLVQGSAAQTREVFAESLEKSLERHAGALLQQQREMVRQGEVMSQVVSATGDVVKLEQALNNNLRELAGAKHFEDTVMSLSAAIHLLNSRLGAVDSRDVRVQIRDTDSQDHAA